MNKALVLLSGGMDSTTLLFYVKRRLHIPVVDTVSFAYGQRHRRELAMAGRQARAAEVREHRLLNLDFLGEIAAPVSALTGTSVKIPDLELLKGKERNQPPTYVPHRNLILLSLAAAYAEARGIRDVYYGAQRQDRYGYWDCTGDFLVRLNRLLKLNRRSAVRVHAPFVGMRKTDELRLGMELGVDYAQTWSCYRGGTFPCGKCPACLERQAAFRELNVVDPLEERQNAAALRHKRAEPRQNAVHENRATKHR